jgi:hypothetical protein
VELRKNTKQISVCRALNTKPPKYRYIATFWHFVVRNTLSIYIEETYTLHSQLAL